MYDYHLLILATTLFPNIDGRAVVQIILTHHSYFTITQHH